MRTLFTALTAAALAFGGLTACAIEDDDSDAAELAEGIDDAKTDQPDFALTELDIDPPTNRFVEKVGVVKSRTAFKQVFGFSAPQSIDFNKEWVAYYTAGAQNSGGYHASIDRVRLSDSGKTLRITAHLNKPGFDCLVTQAITSPYAVVKFKKPASPQPTTNRYYRLESTTNCSAPACAGTTESETIYEDTATPKVACTVDAEHCLTSDHNACPQLSPLPPSYCSGGTVQTVPNYIDSADGMECEIPSVHCVTNDNGACPQFSPLPPNYCPAGTQVVTEPNFISSADGMECFVPRVHCVSTTDPSCPTL